MKNKIKILILYLGYNDMVKIIIKPSHDSVPVKVPSGKIRSGAPESETIAKVLVRSSNRKVLKCFFFKANF